MKNWAVFIAIMSFTFSGLIQVEAKSIQQVPKCLIKVDTEENTNPPNLVFRLLLDGTTVASDYNLRLIRIEYDKYIGTSQCKEVSRELLPSCRLEGEWVVVEGFKYKVPATGMSRNLDDFLGGTLQSFYAARICKNSDI